MIGRKFIKPAEVTPPPVVESEPEAVAANPIWFSPRGPEDAAEVLMKYLPEETQGLIREAQGNRQVPLWHMLLGYVMNASEQSELFNPYVLAAWDAGVGPNESRPCKTCGLPFRSRFPGAQYCCNPCACGKDKHLEDCPTRVMVTA